MDQSDRNRMRSDSGRSQGSAGSKIPRPNYNAAHRPPPMPQQMPSSQSNASRQQYDQGFRTPPNGNTSRPSRSGASTPHGQQTPTSFRTIPRQPMTTSQTSRNSPSKPAQTNRPQQEQVFPTHQKSKSLKSYQSAVSRQTSVSHFVSELDPEDMPSRSYDHDDRVSDISSDDSVRHRNRDSSVVSQASVGRQVRPLVTTMGGWGSAPRSPLSTTGSGVDTPTSENPPSMEALSAAIMQGLRASSAQSNHRPPFGRNQTDPSHVRMPFQRSESPLESPKSPTSIYTDCTVPRRGHDSVPLSAYNQKKGRGSLPLSIPESELSNRDGSPRPPTRLQNVITHSPKSEHSTAQLLGLGIEQRGMSDRIPAGKRPPQLDMGAVRSIHHQRSSTTSLAELIRRATKLASNLDRGKTASRMDLGGREKLGPSHLRASTYSDMLSAFPEAPGTPTSTDKNRQTMWPSAEKGKMQSKSKLAREVEDKKPKRRCLGLSPPCFILVLFVIIALIAAAVCVPVFMVVIPNQKKADATKCSTVSCHNDGIRVNVNSVCSCICAGGYTGNDCSIASAPDCVSATVTDQSNTYRNATMGSSVMPLLSSLQGSSNIPLNATVLLTTFANNNLSCASENSLVTFGSVSKRTMKRFIIFDDASLNVRPIPVPSHISMAPIPTTLAKLPVKRDATDPGAAKTENGIVYATSSVGGGSSSQSATASSESASTAGSSSASTASSATPTASSSPSSSSSSNSTPPTDGQAVFGGAVVLYVLGQERNIQSAVLANQAIVQFFRDGGLHSGKSTVQVTNKIVADFDKMSITVNGQVVGGSAR